MIDVVLDISHHNGKVDFAKVRAAGQFGVAHKATEGTGYVDPMYRTRRSQAEAAGLRWASYHFATRGDGRAQADHFLSTVGSLLGVLLVIDWEGNSGTAMRLEAVCEFVEAVEKAAGRPPGIYSGNTAREVLGPRKDPTLGRSWLWVPRYGGRPPVVPPTWEGWTLHQYTDKGCVDGVDGPVDRNRFNGDERGLRRLWEGEVNA